MAIKETRFNESIEDTTMIYGTLTDGLPFFAWSTRVNADDLLAEVEVAGPGNNDDGQHGWEFHATTQAAFESMDSAWSALVGDNE